MDTDLEVLVDEIEALPGLWVRSGGNLEPSIDDKGAWKLYLQVDPIQGGLFSLSCVLVALDQTAVRCGVRADRGVGPWDTVTHVLASRGGTTPTDAATLIAQQWQEWDEA